MNSLQRLYLVPAVLISGVAIGSPLAVQAASANISQSYSSSKSLIPGSLVSLESDRNNTVRSANTDTGNRLIGIVVSPDESLLAIDTDPTRAQVATSGSAVALASDINGVIKSGDQVSVSPFDGVGMKAANGSRVIGLAESSLSGAAAGIKQQSITDKDGKKRTVQVGYVRVSIAVGSESTAPKQVPQNALQELAMSITGQSVSTTRLAISAFIALVAILTIVTLIYTSVYGTIVAIGRNPLAKNSILRAFSTTIGLVVITALLAFGVIYLIIR